MDNAPTTIEFAGWRCRIGTRGMGLPTRREAELLAGLAAGMTQKEIAKLRGVSPASIKSTAEAAYYRLRANRATDAVARAMRRGWIAPLALALMLADLSGEGLRIRQPTRTRTQVSASRVISRRDLGSIYA
ncbi:LuxR C-terminal-related transcriptional regulator [Halomonas sp. CKK8]|uniref:response regulator transcription factor n=1 Tax=Halomonas sp. CKK8 TaxID=3036127 RepID=UPI0024157C6C|nr:LuxR C-terminal-related transcriptional regulator [Halomonas sp. CKK8]WFM72921.1 LuxR C-terminal-related transcriptional regulator [Halomonas sp. CKK8]